MKKIITILLIINSINLYATDSIIIVKQKIIFELSKNCTDSISWEEIIIKNKNKQTTINNSISSTIESLKLTEPYFEEKCNGTIVYKVSSRIEYHDNNLLSVIFKGHKIWPNKGWSFNIKTLNYNIKTGNLISFHNLFKPEKKPIVDSLIICLMKDWQIEFGIDFQNTDMLEWKVQLINPAFIITSDGITIYLTTIHSGYSTDEDPEFMLSYDEYKEYLNDKYFLKKILGEK